MSSSVEWLPIIYVEGGKTMERILNTREIARMYGVSLYQVHYAILTGRIKAQKWGHIYVVYEKDLPDKWPVFRKGRGRRG